MDIDSTRLFIIAYGLIGFVYNDSKIAALQAELAHVDGEIEKLVDSLIGANNVLLSYVNVKIAELDGPQAGNTDTNSGVDGGSHKFLLQ